MKIKPIILLIVAYQYMRRSDSGSEAIGTMYSAEKQIFAVKEKLSYQHWVVWKLGSDNKVNICELLLNIVTVEKLKMLISFTKRCVVRMSCWMLMARKCCTTGGKAEPKLSNVKYTKHGKPVFFLARGKEIARNLNKMQVEEDRKSESQFIMNWIEIETLFCTKVSRLLSGLWLRDSLKNLYMEESKW